jgi:hypothetical protein
MDVSYMAAPSESHGKFKFSPVMSQQFIDPLLTANGQSVHIWASDEHRSCTEGQRLKGIGAPSDSTVE